MTTHTIRQTVTFPTATPQEVYDLLMDAKKHAVITGSKVSMSKRIGGGFNVFDSYAYGYNIELLPGEKILQAWHFDEKGWAKDYFSICTFTFTKVGKGTKMTFTQRGVPASTLKNLTAGWKDFYWKPMKRYFEAKHA